MSHQFIKALATILLAFLMATLVWIAAIGEEDPIINQVYAENITLNILSPGEGVVIANKENLPTDVQVRLVGPNSAWQSLTPNKLRANVDLTSFEEGLQDVPVTVDISIPELQVLEFFPSQIRVQLEPLLVRELPVAIRIVGEPPKGFTYQLPGEPITVSVKGLSRNVLEVERVEGSLFLNNIREPVERTIRPLAKNRLGETISDVVIDPEQTTVRIGLEQRFGYNNLSVKAKVVGEPASGYFINSITTIPDEIVLRGPDDAPSSLETDIIDITGATADISKRVLVTIPPGFSVEVGENEDPEDVRTIQVDIEVAAFTGGLSVNRPVSVEGVPQNLGWQLEPESVEIFLSGPWPLLQELDDNDVTVIVDLFDFVEGVYRVEPTIIRPQELEVGSVIPDTVVVTLSPNSAVEDASNPPPIEPTESITTSLEVTSTNELEGTSLLTDTIDVAE